MTWSPMPNNCNSYQHSKYCSLNEQIVADLSIKKQFYKQQLMPTLLTVIAKLLQQFHKSII